MTRRIEIEGHARFLTFSCNQRLPLFNNDAIKDRFVDHLSHVRGECGVKLYAWVVMPEHVHLLVRPTHPDCTIQSFLMRLKRPFAKRVIERWRLLEAPILERLVDAQGRTRFWLKGGGYDRTIRSVDEYHEKLGYIEENPARRGLVGRKDDWRWSSWWWRQREGYSGALVDSVVG